MAWWDFNEVSAAYSTDPAKAHGQNFNKDHNIIDLLFWAVEHGDAFLVVMFLSEEYVNERNERGDTLLYVAMRWNEEYVSEQLDAELGPRNWDVFQLYDDVAKARWQRRMELYDEAVIRDVVIVQMLLATGANVNATSSYGQKALHIAVVREWDNDIIQILLEAGADVNARSKWGSTALHAASSKACGGKALAPVQINLLLDAGADVNAINNRGGTALYNATRKGIYVNVAPLLDAGANIFIEVLESEFFKSDDALQAAAARTIWGSNKHRELCVLLWPVLQKCAGLWRPENHLLRPHYVQELVMSLHHLCSRSWNKDVWTALHPESSFPWTEIPLELMWMVCELIKEKLLMNYKVVQ